MVQCPNCGYNVVDDQARICPNCGRALSASLPGYASRSYPPGEAGETPPQPTYPEYPGYAPPSQPMYPPGYGQPSSPSQGYSGYPGYPYGYPPGYGQPSSPSQGYPPGYGQPSSPSQGYPGYPGYPYGYPPGYGQPVPGGPGMPPQKRSRVGLIVSIVLAVVVVIGLLTAGGILALSNSQGGTVSASSTPTPAGVASTATSSTTLIFSDPLTSNAKGWSNDQHCYFRSDGYHINGGWDCFAPKDVPDNFTAQVQVKQVSGPIGDGYGVVFRHTSTGNEYYFLIDGYGHWRVDKCANNTCSPLHNWSSSGGAVKQGASVANTLEVDASGSKFVLLANGTQLGQITDSTFSSGIFGLAGGQSSQVVYTNLVINRIS